MNQITIAGYLGSDPEVRFTSSGQKVTTLRVGAKVRRKRDETIWWRVSIWGEQFDKMITFLKKGSGVICTGDLNKPEIFTDREGKPQVSMNITATDVMFSPFGKSDQQSGQQSGSFQKSNHDERHEEGGQGFGSGQESGHGQQFSQGNPEKEEEMAYGQADLSSSLSDDEIPF